MIHRLRTKAAGVFLSLAEKAERARMAALARAEKSRKQGYRSNGADINTAAKFGRWSERLEKLGNAIKPKSAK